LSAPMAQFSGSPCQLRRRIVAGSRYPGRQHRHDGPTHDEQGLARIAGEGIKNPDNIDFLIGTASEHNAKETGKAPAGDSLPGLWQPDPVSAIDRRPGILRALRHP
jgi:hypothetical protein